MSYWVSTRGQRTHQLSLEVQLGRAKGQRAGEGGREGAGVDGAICKHRERVKSCLVTLLAEHLRGGLEAPLSLVLFVLHQIKTKQQKH
jgi:hypothetical protein